MSTNGRMLLDDVFAVGFRRGEYVRLACTPAGQEMIPQPFEVSKDCNYHTPNMRDVKIAATLENVVALRLAGIITVGDANKILNREVQP